MGLQGTLGFLGFGNMGRAIAGGLIETGTATPDQIIAYDISDDAQAAARQAGIGLAESAAALAGASDSLVLAVKPQTMAEAVDSVTPHTKPDTLFISIAAGVSINWLQDRLGAGARIVRVMPNTPALVGAGAAGVALSDQCTDADAATAQTIFEAVGVAVVVSEEAIDAVTALSGSGPAYFFRVVECLIKAARAEGLPEDLATRLAGQTLLGAGRLLMESGESAAVLRQRVTSKGGTTEAALRTFDERGLEDTIIAGVRAAAARSRELGK